MRYILILTMLMLFASLATAADVTLAWDPAPADQTWDLVRIYEKNGDGTGGILYEMKAEVPGTQTQATIANVTPGVHIYVARSVAQPWGESSDSNEAKTPLSATPPGRLRVTVTVEIDAPN